MQEKVFTVGAAWFFPGCISRPAFIVRNANLYCSCQCLFIDVLVMSVPYVRLIFFPRLRTLCGYSMLPLEIQNCGPCACQALQDTWEKDTDSVQG